MADVMVFNLTDYTHFGPPLCDEGQAGTNLTVLFEAASALPAHDLSLLNSESMSAYYLGVVFTRILNISNYR